MINYDYLELHYVLVVCDIKDSVFSSFLALILYNSDRKIHDKVVSEIVAARQGIKPRTCSSASRELNHYTTAAPNLVAYDPVHAKYEVIILCFKRVIYVRL